MNLPLNTILQGDCLEMVKTIPDNSIDCCITSPPYYGLRDYGVDGQIGLEETPEEYIDKLTSLFREVRRVLKDDGTLWVNIGDSYAAQRGGTYQPAESLAGGIGGKTVDGEKVNRGRAEGYNPTRNAAAIGLKHKDLIGIPWMLAFALRSDGWYLRQDIIWHKPNPMPESVKDRCTKSHEYIFLLSKSPHYYFDYEAIQEEATGYDGRKDTMHKGSKKYTQECMPGMQKQEMASRAHERWKFKNLQDKGQTTQTMHERRAEGKQDILYPVRNKRDVWSVPVKPCKEAHFAIYPEELIKPCILAGCKVGGIVLDPFFGSGTTGRVAEALGRNYIGCELNPEYVKIAEKRTSDVQLTIMGFM